MQQILSLPEYEEALAASRDRRMAWWREARFGMFVHLGLYSTLKRHEWARGYENIPAEEYEKLAEEFGPREGAPLEWAKLAAAAGMKYAVLTTRHHEGFSLWDSKVNPFNSVNYGPHRDIVREFVEACRTYGLRIGFYSSLMDWHHPDGGRAAYDSEARSRFNNYIYELNRELLTQYGKIDILWYDVPMPMGHAEGWNSLERNQRLRELQPDIIINNRSWLPEDYGTPEEHLTPEKNHDWEACMTFNGMSWGYIDSEQAKPYSYNAQRILRMLQKVSYDAGNLLLNIGPAPDGSVPADAFEPLSTVGEWLRVNGECLYGKIKRSVFKWSNGLCSTSYKENTVYFWNWIWPEGGELTIGGFTTKLNCIRIVGSNETVSFSQESYRIFIKDLPKASPDKIMGVTVLALEFEEEPRFVHFASLPQLHEGKAYM